MVISELVVAAAAVCSWNQPGTNPYRLEPVRALASYKLSPAQRDGLTKKMLVRKYDDLVEITPGSIKGQHTYSDLRNMHFGHGTVCVSVDRSRMPKPERALVYCVDGACVAVPTVCNNVSMVTRNAASARSGAVAGATAEQGAGDAPGGSAAQPTQSALTDRVFPFSQPHAPGMAEGSSGVGFAAQAADNVALSHDVDGWRSGSGPYYMPVPMFYPFVPMFEGAWGPDPVIPAPVPTPIPEPGTLWLFLLGMSALQIFQRTKENSEPSNPNPGH